MWSKFLQKISLGFMVAGVFTLIGTWLARSQVLFLNYERYFTSDTLALFFASTVFGILALTFKDSK